MKTCVLKMWTETTLFLILTTALTGIGYPFLMNLIGKTFFPKQATGSLIIDNRGNIIGSSLIGQSFSEGKYFHPRISYAGPLGYDGEHSQASFLVQSSEKFLGIVYNTAEGYRAINQIDSATLLPADAVTSSASGLDPHITLQNAKLQAERVAANRDLSLEAVMSIVNNYVERSYLTEQPYINVLKVNIALDTMAMTSK